MAAPPIRIEDWENRCGVNSPFPSNLIWWELLAGLKPSLPAQTLSGLNSKFVWCTNLYPIILHYFRPIIFCQVFHIIIMLTFIESMPGTVLRLSRCLRILMTALEFHLLL